MHQYHLSYKYTAGGKEGQHNILINYVINSVLAQKIVYNVSIHLSYKNVEVEGSLLGMIILEWVNTLFIL